MAHTSSPSKQIFGLYDILSLFLYFSVWILDFGVHVNGWISGVHILGHIATCTVLYIMMIDDRSVDVSDPRPSSPDNNILRLKAIIADNNISRVRAFTM
jgi:hypothetical protein